MASCPSYGLSRDVYSCVANRHLVFLDLRRDKYLCLDQDSSAVLLAGVSGSQHAESQDLLEQIAGSLLNQELLDGRSVGRAIGGAPDVEAPRRALSEGDDLLRGTISFADRICFMRAATYIRARLKFLAIKNIVDGIREKRETIGPSITSIEDAYLHRMVTIYRRLRPQFPAKYCCLFDSLALLEFLGSHRLLPTLVFGVKMDPWGAHCWLQDGDVVVNDTVEYVRDFAPIMAA